MWGTLTEFCDYHTVKTLVIKSLLSLLEFYLFAGDTIYGTFSVHCSVYI